VGWSESLLRHELLSIHQPKTRCRRETRRNVEKPNGSAQGSRDSEAVQSYPTAYLQDGGTGEYPFISDFGFGSVRFDPGDVAVWLKEKQSFSGAAKRIGSSRVAD
jgi:hypothetical protein